MKLKLTPLYVFSFFCLNFFVMEMHDWAHAAVAALVGGGWGPRGFDGWQFPSDISVSNGQRAVATLAGPLVNFLVIWIGWKKMGNRESLADQSFGINLVLAALPLALLMAAFSGGGDLTGGLRLLSSHIDGVQGHLIPIVGVLIILFVCIPPIVHAFILLPGWLGKWVYLPLFLVAPVYVHRWVVHNWLNSLLEKYEPDGRSTYVWIFLWTIAMLGGWLFTRRKLETLLLDIELPL